MIKVFLLAYIVFTGCWVFPIRSEQFPFDCTKGYLLIASYGVIGLAFAKIYGRDKKKLIYVLKLLLTIIGMIGRYLLEYGEFSNTYNFTLEVDKSENYLLNDIKYCQLDFALDRKKAIVASFI